MAQVRRQTTEAASAPRPRQVMLSVFDLDRTLTVLPTYTPFLFFAARSRAPWRLLLLPLLLPIALLYALKLVPRRWMKQAMHRVAIGSALPTEPPPAICAAAERALATLAALGHAGHSYARVDGVPSQGEFLIMELELLEPSLYLAGCPAAAERLARHLADTLR